MVTVSPNLPPPSGFVSCAARAQDKQLLGPVAVCELQPAPLTESARMVAAIVAARSGTQVDMSELVAAVKRIGTRPGDLDALTQYDITARSGTLAAP